VASDRPDLIMITGFARPAARAADMNLRADTTPWTHNRTPRTSGAVVSQSSRSPKSTSA